MLFLLAPDKGLRKNFVSGLNEWKQAGSPADVAGSERFPRMRVFRGIVSDRVAPLRRSPSGLIKAITQWLDYGDH